MPPLSTEAYDALKADIAAHGVQVPITVDQHGRVLDGNNRAAIAAELGITCPSTTVLVVDDDDAIDRAVTLNCARRHLTREQVREIIAAEIARRPDDSDRAIARRVGCSPSTVGAVRGLSKLDTPALSEPPNDVDPDLLRRILRVYDHSMHLRPDLPRSDADAARARAIMLQHADETFGLTPAIANDADLHELVAAILGRMALWRSIGMDRQLIRNLFIPWLNIALSDSACAEIRDDPSLAYLTRISRVAD